MVAELQVHRGLGAMMLAAGVLGAMVGFMVCAFLNYMYPEVKKPKKKRVIVEVPPDEVTATLYGEKFHRETCEHLWDGTTKRRTRSLAPCGTCYQQSRTSAMVEAQEEDEQEKREEKEKLCLKKTYIIVVLMGAIVAALLAGYKLAEVTRVEALGEDQYFASKDDMIHSKVKKSTRKKTRVSPGDGQALALRKTREEEGDESELLSYHIYKNEPNEKEEYLGVVRDDPEYLGDVRDDAECPGVVRDDADTHTTDENMTYKKE